MKKEYWATVYRCRDYIVESMRNEAIWFTEVTDKMPVPLWNQIEENGAIGLICQCNGLPTCLLTPLGEINFIRRKTGFPDIDVQKKERFMKKLTEEFGLVLVAKRNVYGEEHPVYSITTLPWDSKVAALPILVERKHSDEEIDKDYKKAKRMITKLFN